MKKIFLTLALGAGIAIAGCDSKQLESYSHSAAETADLSGQAYICPMKCEGSDKPGKCSMCDMDLVKNPDYKGAAAEEAEHTH